MFNIKNYSSIYKTYINYMLHNLYTLFFDIVKYNYKSKRENRNTAVKHIKIYFDLLSVKSIDKISYNSDYLLSSSTSYYSLTVPIKFIFNNHSKSVNFRYNILNIPKIDTTGNIFINGFNRTPVLHLKSIIKHISVIGKKKRQQTYLIHLKGFNYLYITIKNNKYVYISVNDKRSVALTYNSDNNVLHKNFIKLNIYEFLNNVKVNYSNTDYIYSIYSTLCSVYCYSSFNISLLNIINKFINIKYKKNYLVNSDSFVNKSVNNITNNMFNLIKQSFAAYAFLEYCDPESKSKNSYYSISLFRENFLLNPSLHYTNQLNLLSYLHNKFKLNIFGHSNTTNSTFTVPKYLRKTQYFYLNFINILYTIDGEKCGILSTATTNTLEKNTQLKTSIINKKKFNNNIYLDLKSKNLYKTVTNSYNIVKKSLNFKITHIEVIENGEFKLIKLKKNKSNVNFSFYNIFNITELLIPFLLNNDICRSLMGSKMQTQATPIIYSQVPYVYTKYNKITNTLINKCIVSFTEGIIVTSTNYKITILDNNNRYINYYLSPYNVHDYNSYTRYKPIVWEGEKSNIGAVLAVPSDISNSEFTLGFNNLVNYGFYYGYEHEDAIVLNKQIVYKNILASLEFNIDDINLTSDKNNYLEILTIKKSETEQKVHKTFFRLFPKLQKQKQDSLNNLFRRKRLKKIKHKITITSKCIYSSTSYLQKLLKCEYLFCPNYVKIGNIIIYANVKLFLVHINNINVGDKLCGKHGNKGTISKIIETSDVPYTSTDRTSNIITSPIGAASRMNVGQFLEGYVGNISYNDNIRVKAPINLASSDLYSYLYIKSICNYLNNKYIINKSNQYAVSVFRDFKTGYKLKNFTHHVCLYFFKLMHTSKSKFKYRATFLPSLVQKIYNDSSEQKFGEMEVWSLEAHGAAYNLRELSLIKTDVKFFHQNIDKQTLISKTFTHLIMELSAILVSVKYNNYLI
uniref:DNA-directed RNA polymerase n=1 Tax=Babesia orientalis TaxID=273649 RepID=A0A0M4MEZ4_9APIC|nr:DNA-directed RNA polymerase subunit beta [Babesia orientalis]ALE29344.1 DNA-directed RNA polymerase subunit beta [Babesia orientalis]